MRNNNIGFYVGFSLFAIQMIAGDLYRDYKQQECYNRINRRLLIISATATTTAKAQESSNQ